MKKTDFFKRINTVVVEAIEFISQAAIKKGKITFYEGEGEDDDAFYDLPTITSVSKHGFYDQFAIIGLSHNGQNVILHTKGRGEDSSDRDFILSENSDESQINRDDSVSICEIADLVAKEL
jgi:hypothetical protein